MIYQETNLVRIAQREQNEKRKYLVVNPLQGKHVPVSPKGAMQVMDALADLVRHAYPREKLLLVGFAETATAIGARLAVKLEAGYMQTTREQIPGVDYLYFTESHSHATEQKLVKDDLDAKLDGFDRVVFVEDEVTTGNTILKIVEIMEKTYPEKVHFSVASLLNGMGGEALKRYQEHGILLHYLVKTDHSTYTEQAEACRGDGTYVPFHPQTEEALTEEIVLSGYRNSRRYVDGREYADACESLWKQIREKIHPERDRQYLVLGTEEFMYPALYVAARLERRGSFVRFHATTRSPIAVSTEETYPLHTRYELRSMYEQERRTFVYDLRAYDEVLIITDAAENASAGVNSLVHALKLAGNENIVWYRWCEHEKLL